MTADQNPYSPSSGDVLPRKPRFATLVLCGGGVLVVLFLLVVTAVGSYIAGAIHATSELYHNRASHEARQIRAYLQQHPDRFSQVTVEEISSGHSYLYGTVNSQEDLFALRSEMQRLFGMEQGREMTAGVEVAPASGRR